MLYNAIHTINDYTDTKYSLIIHIFHTQIHNISKTNIIQMCFSILPRKLKFLVKNKLFGDLSHDTSINH